LRFIKTTILLISVTVLMTGIVSCKKDSGGTGSNVLPTSDLLYAVYDNSINVQSSVLLRDSVPGWIPAFGGVSNCLVGSYDDPVFGLTKMSFYTQMLQPYNISDTSINHFGNTGSILDSTVLIMAVTGIYPPIPTNTPEVFEVDTLNKALNSDSSYYSNAILAHGGRVGLSTFTPPTVGSNLRIKLNKTWANRLFYNPATLTSASFTTFFNGLYVTVNNPLQLNGQGSIVYLNPAGNVTFYYHQNRTGDSNLYQEFPIGTTAAYFNHADFDYAYSPFYNHHPLGASDSVSSPNLIYVQTMGGVIGKIGFPNLKKYVKNGKIIVNQALLVFTVDASAIGNFEPPQSMELLGIDSVNGGYVLPDEALGINYYNGQYNSAANTYSFNIAEYIQAVLSGKIIDRGLYLISESNAVTASRVALFGGNAGASRITLNMYYTPVTK
jgi:hypothetical protein